MNRNTTTDFPYIAIGAFLGLVVFAKTILPLQPPLWLIYVGMALFAGLGAGFTTLVLGCLSMWRQRKK